MSDRGRISAHVALVLFAGAALPRAAFAHPGGPPAPHDAWTAWTWGAGQLVLVALAAGLYARGVHTLWGRAGVGAGVSRRAAAAFAAGWVALVAALISPVHAIGEALFAAHMVQHELLMAVAAPLLVLGRPVVAILWAVPRAWRRGAGVVGRSAAARWWGWLTRPGPATALHGAALWLWHAPPLYGAALRSETIHAMEHAWFLGTALLFWWAVLAPRARGAGAGGGIFALLVTTIHTGVLGAMLAMSDRAWYPAYTRTTAAWGLTPLEDQQLGGTVMWMPGGLPYVAAALWLFTCWLRESERRAQVREAHDDRLFAAVGSAHAPAAADPAPRPLGASPLGARPC